jgi:hypothetical protein
MMDAEDAFRDSMARADLAGQIREQLAARWMTSMILMNGPTPVPDALQQIEQLARDLPTEIPGLLLDQAVLHAMQDRFDDAHAFLGRARTLTVDEMRAPRLLVFVEAAEATVASLSGDLEAAAAATRARLDIALKGEEQENIAQASGWLSLLQRLLGRNSSEAAALSAARAPFGVPGRAIAMAANGDAQAAADLVSDEMPLLRADMLLEIPGSDEARAEAARLYRLKGNLVSADHLRPTAVAPT